MGIFLRQALDDPNQIEPKREFSLCRHSGARKATWAGQAVAIAVRAEPVAAQRKEI
jgi:hypothetical protein